MKKRIAILLMLALLAVTVGAQAADSWTTIDGQEQRGITVTQVGDHRFEKGVSPTTGLALDSYADIPGSYRGLAVNGRYMPMVVQIDNTNGGVGDNQPWGVQYADVIYETPLYSQGVTRLTAVFSDVLPDDVGPVRSARVGHARLAAEWMGGFVHYGRQQYPGTNVDEELSKKEIHIIRGKNRFDGTDGINKPWKQFFTARPGAKSPSNRTANVAALSELVAEDVTPINHAFLFTDELLGAGDEATVIELDISKGAAYNSRFYYDAAANEYVRYMLDKQGGETLYVERETQQELTFSNVIIQYTRVTYDNGSDAPDMRTLGEGNADIFMGGCHIAGYWKHDEYHSRTVFYDAQGNEIALQRGKTFISVMDRSKKVSYK